MIRRESTETRVEPVDLLRPRLKGVVLKRAGLALALWGEPGIGKSHAAQQLLRETPCRSFGFPALVPLGVYPAREQRQQPDPFQHGQSGGTALVKCCMCSATAYR